MALPAIAALSFLAPLILGGCSHRPATSGVATRLFIAGDSTAATYTATDKNQQGWGAELQRFFAPHRLQVVNAARGGRSSRTFITEGHWARMLSEVRRGDFVIIQFGHNDAGALNQEPPGSTRPLRARGTIPGIGADFEEIDNVVTGQQETVHTFGWYLRKMIADTRARGATPVLLTLTRTNHWSEGRIQCPSGTYRSWDWQIAQAERVAFVDLTRITADRYQQEGQDAVNAQFVGDAVHTNVEGASRNAADVVSGLRAQRALPFRKMLSASGRAVPADAGPDAGSVCPPLP